MAAAPHALWYRTHLPPPGATVVAARNGAHVCEVAYSVPGAGVDIPGGLVHGTAPSTVEPAERERMLENMFQFVAPPAGAGWPKATVYWPPAASAAALARAARRHVRLHDGVLRPRQVHRRRAVQHRAHRRADRPAGAHAHTCMGVNGS